MQEVYHQLQYAASWPNATVCFHASDMRLIDASYLFEIQSSGIFYLSSSGDPSFSLVNGAIDIVSVIIPSVVAAGFEAEYAALFLNGRTAISTILTLCDLGYPQQKTPLTTDNTTSAGIANRTSEDLFFTHIF